MDAIDLVHKTATAIHDVPATFMLTPTTYQDAAARGYIGADFYFAGRGGVLGEAPASVVAATFMFFATQAVTDAWERSAGIEPRHDAANAFAQAGHLWGRENLDASASETIAEIAGIIVAAADPASAPLFAGWRELTVPSDAQAAAFHHLNGLRELRGGIHASAVRTAGVPPRQALALDNEAMAPIHGWNETVTPDETLRPALEQAVHNADARMAEMFQVVNDAQAEAFAHACTNLCS